MPDRQPTYKVESYLLAENPETLELMRLAADIAVDICVMPLPNYSPRAIERSAAVYGSFVYGINRGGTRPKDMSDDPNTIHAENTQVAGGFVVKLLVRGKSRPEKERRKRSFHNILNVLESEAFIDIAEDIKV